MKPVPGPVGAAHLAAMTAVGATVRVGLALAIGARAPLGEDAAYLGYDAMELASGRYVGDFPPIYLAMSAAAAALGGASIGTVAQVIAFVAGCAIAPCVAIATAAIGGTRAGRLSGWIALTLPALTAWSLRVEPTTLLAVGIAAASWLAARAVRTASVAWAGAFGLVAGSLPLVKENGLIVPLALGAAVAPALPGRARIAAAAGVVACVVAAAGLEGASAHGGLRGKLAFPTAETVGMITKGQLPSAFQTETDPVVRPRAPEIRGITRPDATPTSRAPWVAGLLARRALWFLGPWALAVPATALGLVVARRRGRIERWEAGVPGALAATVVPLVAILHQPRHAEIALLGGVVSLGIALDRLAGPGLRASAVLVFGAWGAFKLVTVEVPRARSVADCANDEADVGAWVETHVDVGDRLCSDDRWIGFRTNRLVLDCGVGRTPAGAWRVGWKRQVANAARRDAALGLVDDLTSRCHRELALARSTPPAAHPPSAGPNFLVLDIDTLAVERVGAVRDGRSVTPAIDALTRRGVRFTRAFSQGGWTMPGVSAILTGVHPVATSARGGSISWRSASTRDLAGILDLYGYNNAVFWGATLPGRTDPGLSRSFHTVSVTRDPGDAPRTDEVVRWLEGAPSEPFFAYVHEADLHNARTFAPIDGRYPFDGAATVGAPREYAELYTALLQSIGDVAARDAAVARYDGVLHLYDAALETILAALDRSGAADRTVVVLLSDHGEDFFEHALFDHGQLYDTTLHVPLIVVDPAATARAGEAIDTLVQMVDVAPTLLARAGIPRDAAMDGASLLPLLGLGASDEGYAERPVFSITGTCHASLREPSHKLILRDPEPQHGRRWRPSGGDPAIGVPLAAFLAERGLTDLALPRCARDPGVAIELYDLVSDPLERSNVASSQPDVVERLLRALLERMAGAPASAIGGPALTAEQIAVIRDQGYWGLVQPDSAGTTPP